MSASPSKHVLDRLAGVKLPGTVWFGSKPREPMRYLVTGIPQVDEAFGGGLPRGNLCQIVGPPASGRTSLVYAILSSATRQGELAAMIDVPDALHPRSLQAAGATLERILWIRPPSLRDALKCAELLLSSGGFGLVVLDLDVVGANQIPLHVWPRLAQKARESRASVPLLFQHPAQGIHQVLSVRGEVLSAEASTSQRTQHPALSTQHFP